MCPVSWSGLCVGSTVCLSLPRVSDVSGFFYVLLIYDYKFRLSETARRLDSNCDVWRKQDTNGQTEGQMDGRTDGPTTTFVYLEIFPGWIDFFDGNAFSRAANVKQSRSVLFRSYVLESGIRATYHNHPLFVIMGFFIMGYVSYIASPAGIQC